jgi:tetratricopeptide (TPR) repeat protein
MVRLLGQADKHPNDPDLFGGLVQACRYCGLLEESIRAHQRARLLDPRIVTSVAFTYFLLGDYERAIEWYPPGTRFYLDLAALAAAGREAEAAELLSQRHFAVDNWPEMESLRHSLRGDRAGSLAIVRRALANPSPDPENKFHLARQLARDGEHAEALKTVRDAAAEGYFCSHALRSDPWLRPLARLPDFSDVLDDTLRREAEARAAFLAAGGDRILS